MRVEDHRDRETPEMKKNLDDDEIAGWHHLWKFDMWLLVQCLETNPFGVPKTRAYAHLGAVNPRKDEARSFVHWTAEPYEVEEAIHAFEAVLLHRKKMKMLVS